MTEVRECFVISPIGEPESDTRRRSDQVLRHIIRPAVEHCGYRAVRADEIDKPGIITSQVLQHVVGDPLVIADLSETNPNVFYELAVRHAIKKPLVQIIRKGERIPFDVAGTRTIHFDHQDLDSVDEAKRGIIEQVKWLEENPNDIETPISISLDLQMLRQSEDPEDRSLAEIVALINSMRSGIGKLEEKISHGSFTDSSIIDSLKEELEMLPIRVVKEIMGHTSKPRKNWITDPYFVQELVSMVSSIKSNDPLSMLVILSFYRDQFPWLYEIGMDAYRRATAGDWDGARDVIRELEMLTEMSLRGHIRGQALAHDKETYAFMTQLPLLLRRVMDEAMMRTKIKQR